MPQSADFYDADFDAQLQGLFQQAERAIGHRSGDGEQAASVKLRAETEADSGESNPSASASVPASAAGLLPAVLKPLMREIESVAKATSENNALLRRLDPASSDIAETQKGMLKLMSDLRAIVEARNTVSQNMFSALHQELKGYKDGFLLQTVHRPIIRDLVTLYDDIAELHRQLAEIEPNSAGTGQEKADANPILERVRQVSINMANNKDFILEVLARLEVTIMPPGPDRLDKLTQKAVNVELAATPEEDGAIVRSVKRGFLWKDAVFRPEEVVIKRWKQSAASEPPPAPKQ